MAWLELAAVRAHWGPARTSRANEVLWAVGHQVSPMWRLQYWRVLWLARQAGTPGAGQVLVQAILEETDRPPDHDLWAGPCSRSGSCAGSLCTSGGCGACWGGANSCTWS